MMAAQYDLTLNKIPNVELKVMVYFFLYPPIKLIPRVR